MGSSLTVFSLCAIVSVVHAANASRTVFWMSASLSMSTDAVASSIIKTRELRAELAERATENVHAEAKIREVETELSVAHASTDMIATGILDYRLAQDEEDEEQQSADEDEATRVSQSTH